MTLKLADLGLPADILSDARRWMSDMMMSEDVFLDYMIETYGPDEDKPMDDRDRARQAVGYGVERLRDVEAEADVD